MANDPKQDLSLPVATRLRQLREGAEPPISLSKMGRALGMHPTSYARYEDSSEYRRPYLDVEIARKVSRVLADRGVKQADVMALAGVNGVEAPALSSVEEAWLAICHAMVDHQRRLVLDLARALAGPQ